MSNLNFAIGIDKNKSHHIINAFETLEQATVAGEASDYHDYVALSATQLAERCSLTELASMFNNLPGEEQVTRFSDKPSAVKRVLQKFNAASEQLSNKKPVKKRTGAKGRPAAKIEGKIRAVKRDGKRWQEGSPRSKAHALLASSGPLLVETLIGKMADELKIKRPQALGIISKLRASKMVEEA